MKATSVVSYRLPEQFIVGNRQGVREDIERLATDDVAAVITDWSGVRFADSAALGIILAIAKRFQERNQLLLCDQVDADIMTLFDLTKSQESLFVRYAKSKGAPGDEQSETATPTERQY